MFALQLIKKFEEIFKKVDIFVKPYEVIITSETSGLIEFLNNTNSIDGILKNIPSEWDLNKFYRNFFKGEAFKRAQIAFADSLAGFCLLSYYLDIKDRHNGNIMIDNKGHILHIDFGFLLGTSPKNLGFERAQFKLVKSYVDILDGLDGNMFKYFKSQMVRGIIEAKKYYEIIQTIIKVMSHSNIVIKRRGLKNYPLMLDKMTDIKSLFYEFQLTQQNIMDIQAKIIEALKANFCSDIVKNKLRNM